MFSLRLPYPRREKENHATKHRIFHYLLAEGATRQIPAWSLRNLHAGHSKMVTSFWQMFLSLALFHPGLTNRLFAPIAGTKHATLRFSKTTNKSESKHVESVCTQSFLTSQY
jgi:hypothetical protein